ncbi:MAG: sulfite exporter TauE/SafE family protein [Magnetococcus sp. DMHC-1]|nr:sulfite exporter TauE/SafE family protein [Magnetococcales bacterium]
MTGMQHDMAGMGMHGMQAMHGMHGMHGLPEMAGLDYWGVFLAGMLASGHCVGMCGGLITAYSLRSGVPGQGWWHWRRWMPHLFYHVGRVGMYAFLGMLAGWAGSLVAVTGRLTGLGGIPHLVFGATMIVFGLGALGWSPLAIENRFSGGLVARWAGLLQGRGVWQVLLLGVLTGLLPCSLHWAFQAKAAATGSVWGGVTTMLAFGLGTTPPLVLVGMLATTLGHVARQWLLRGAGVLVILMGVRAMYQGAILAGF